MTLENWLGPVFVIFSNWIPFNAVTFPLNVSKRKSVLYGVASVCAINPRAPNDNKLAVLNPIIWYNFIFSPHLNWNFFI